MALASSVRIEIAGKKVEDFLEFYIDQKMHQVQEFRILCRMDTFETPDDSVLNQSKNFIGSPVIIAISTFNSGWQDSSPGFLFKGFIHSVRAVKSNLNEEDKIILEGYSPEILLNNSPGCLSFENMTLKQIVENVLKAYPRDILASKVDPVFTEQIPYCVRYNESGLAFLQRLAARYGEWMFYNGKEFIFGKWNGNQEELILGKELRNLDFSINLRAPKFKYVSYNYLNGEKLETEVANSDGNSQQNEVGKVAHSTSWKQMGQKNTQFFPHLNAVPGKEMIAQKTSVEIKASGIAMNMSGIKGESENMNLIPGTKISVKEAKATGGEINYGDYFIDSVHHHCDNLMNYENTFTGIPAEAKNPPYSNPEMFPVCEPQTAIVKDNKDPEKLGRVKVSFFWQESGQMSPWIRVSTPYAAADRGFYFIPEIDDEVLVGFDGGDAERPFVIGSLYHGKNKPMSGWPNNNNRFKGFVTKSNLRLEFDDDKKVTTIDTPGGNKIIISDDQKSILMNDQNNNKVELSSSGIVLKSPGDISIQSSSKITIDASAGIEISSEADVKMKGLNIDQNADVGFTAKANATAELSASGNTTVKGALVMIN